jgi:hypothetical protein
LSRFYHRERAIVNAILDLPIEDETKKKRLNFLILLKNINPDRRATSPERRRQAGSESKGEIQIECSYV